jgi:uncharacterized integral membrane protein
LRRFFRWIIGAPIVILVVSFAVANRRWVTLSLDPFSQDAPFAAIDMPLWLLLFVGVFIGILVGWAASWLAHGKWRRAAREARTEVADLRQQVADLKKGDGPSATRDVTAYPGSFL